MWGECTENFTYWWFAHHKFQTWLRTWFHASHVNLHERECAFGEFFDHFRYVNWLCISSFQYWR